MSRDIVAIGLSIEPDMGTKEGAGCTVEESGVELGPPTHFACVMLQNGPIPEAGGMVRLCGVLLSLPHPGAISTCSGSAYGSLQTYLSYFAGINPRREKEWGSLGKRG